GYTVCCTTEGRVPWPHVYRARPVAPRKVAGWPRGRAGNLETRTMKERLTMGWIRAIVAVAMLVGSGTGALRPAAGTPPATPRFEPTACHFKLGAGIVAGRDVRCGFVM